jgi:cellulose synthase/poly-beta-1,6-N-acetylglucosamine synthase-like glycosyltransferase
MLIGVLTALLWALAACLLVISAYMLVMILGAWMYRLPAAVSRSTPRVVVLVPAHDEEAGIARTVKSLLDADYAPGEVRVVVIADNCTDGTALQARQVGATVLERFDQSNRGKGPALDWCLKTAATMLAEYDLVAFVDADMVVNRRFFRALAEAFADGSVKVVQGKYVMSNQDISWLGAIGFASFAYVNHVRPAGRCFVGGSADLKGGGMVFRRELILATGWPAHSIAEDIEFGKDLILRGVRVVYAPDAVVVSDIPRALRDVAVQQTRWEAGKRHVLPGYFLRLWRAWLARPSILLSDAVLDLCVPPLSVVALLSIVGLVLSVSISSVSATAFLAAIAVFTAAVVTGLVQLRAPARVWGYLVLAPVFMTWKLGLLLRIVSGPIRTQWQRTPRATNSGET